MACKMVFFPRKISRKGYPARPSWTILVSVWHVCRCALFLAERSKKWRQESPALAGLRLWRPY
ncbi:hypothetical protein EAN86_16260 [Klebsiella pneumoniae]|nr:hypothetical protein EAN86_16260 [Klebsiella pneumoniae]